jgi:hypothetical protein
LSAGTIEAVNDLPFADLPIVDNHAHSMLRPERVATEPLVRFFSEAHDAVSLAGHARQSLFYRSALRDLAELLGCEPSEAAVAEARSARPLGEYLPALLRRANVDAVLIDDGYPRDGTLSVSEMGAQGQVVAKRILRLETLAEGLIPAHDSVASLDGALIAALERDASELAGLKSVVAYRTGLQVEQPARGALTGALDQLRRSWAGGDGGASPGRLASKPLNDHLLLLAAEWAGARGLPVQLHTGFGDRDLDLRLANPAHLRPALEGGPLAAAKVVLLHASYPYCREAAYLAEVYPNVYVDLSAAAPLLAGPVLTRVLEELLALAPVTKLLYGSDAWGIPEWLLLAATAVRRALSEATTWLPVGEARWAAARILAENATELYRL